jgi:hypothetical protein
VDHRLIREGYVQRCSALGLGLYLILVTVGDREGVSYYSDKRLCVFLGCGRIDLGRARRELQEAGLLAYEAPFYQVLDLGPDADARKPGKETPSPSGASAEEVSVMLREWKERNGYA